MKVSVIIVNWNGLAVLQDCLKALREQVRQPHQVIVVDNGSSDGSVAYLETLSWSVLTLVCLSENHGFAGGNNAAWPYIQGDLVALLNNDAQAQPDWIAKAVPHFEDGEVGMLACKIVRQANPEIIDKAGHLMFRDGLNRGRGTGHLASEYQAVCEVLWPDGCACFYRKSLLDTIGFFDEDFFLYGEDADLGFRARWAGARCVYEPGSEVHHHHSASLGKFSPKKAYYIERNRLWVLIKNFPLDWLFLSLFYTFGRYAMNLVSMVRGSGSAAGFQAEHGGWQLAKALVCAGWDGLLGIRKMWAKRRQQTRSISVLAMKQLLKRHQISLRDITLSD